MGKQKSPKRSRGKGYVEIYCKYITVKGKRVYPKNASCFHFWVKKKK